MKFDILIIRIGFVLILALLGFLLDPMRQPDGSKDWFTAERGISAILGVIAALLIIGFEMRARQASIKTLIGAAIGSILGIIGAYLIGMLISTQETEAVPAGMKTFLTVALAFFMG
ncbi:MAG TPA: hypothetical protein PKE69_16065, partial [Pyrinomonadaceae bacterium]|nr:hypothetical protein [Pyrinomonadaceae bacterium]